MVSWRYKRTSSIIKSTNAEVIVIPRFREFSKNFGSNNAFVYFVSKKPNVEIYLKSVSISTAARNADKEVIRRSFKPEIVMLESPIQETKKTLDYPYELVRVFTSGSGVTASDWNHENKLIFTVTYSIDGDPEITEKFIMEKDEYTGIAWPT